MKASDWEDYASFAAVARHGALSGAAVALGISVPTLSRRMRRFEADLGRRLFLHGRAGYQLTAEGRALWDRTRDMEAAAANIETWRATTSGPTAVRISAGTWTLFQITEGLREIWTPAALWCPEFLQGERRLDLARREIDIGIRNARPEQPWLAGRQLGTTQFAVYGSTPDVTGWIGLSRDTTPTPSSRWVEDHHGGEIITRTNTPFLAYQMARAGVGRVVLPMAIGDGTNDLVRLSEVLPDLITPQWLVSHQDARDDPPIRAALDALAAFFTPRNKR